MPMRSGYGMQPGGKAPKHTEAHKPHRRLTGGHQGGAKQGRHTEAPKAKGSAKVTGKLSRRKASMLRRGLNPGGGMVKSY